MNLPTQRSLKVGGYTFTQAQLDSANFVALSATVYSGATRTGLRKANGTTDYQVPTGKTLTIMAVVAWSSVGVTNATYSINLLYGTAATGTNAGVPAGAVDAYGSSSWNMMAVSSVNQGKAECYIHDFAVPALNYPALYSRLSAEISVTVYGMLS